MLPTLLTIATVFITSLGFSKEPISQEELTSSIKNHQLYCVQKWEERKVYLNPESIQIIDNGIYLDLNGSVQDNFRING